MPLDVSIIVAATVVDFTVVTFVIYSAGNEATSEACLALLRLTCSKVDGEHGSPPGACGRVKKRR